jgi:hypothetical protein
LDADAERIPIDLGYDVSAPAGQVADPRVTVREDGTVVIDVLAAQPCAPDPTTEEEIVVCADVAGEGQAPIPPPADPSPTQVIGEALYAKVGPLELGSIPKADGTRAFGARIRF